MKLATVNWVNIGLMVVSFVAASKLPFELFLFSYAVLGPLHYLTQISWLHDRKFFTPLRHDWMPLVGLALLYVLLVEYVLPGGYHLEGWGAWSPDVTFAAFGLALVIVVLKTWSLRLIGLIPIAIGIALLHTEEHTADNAYYSIFAVYLPTLIHVYVFTGAFVLLGALRSKSPSGLFSFAVFVGCSVAVLLSRGDASGYSVSPYVKESYKTFLTMNDYLDAHFGSGILQRMEDFFSDPFSVKMSRFIAFAYTYHFLNWFSKTSVIRWHQVPKSRFICVVILWLASVGIYAYDFLLGFRWLITLSLTHVYLEFPLNHQSFMGIGRELRRLVGGRSAA